MCDKGLFRNYRQRHEMKNFNKFVSGLTLVAISTACPSKANGETYMVDTGGGAYQQVHTACYYLPAVAMAAGVIALIVVIGLSNGNSTHSH